MLGDPSSENNKGDPLPRPEGDGRGGTEPILGASPHAKIVMFLVVAVAVGASAYWLVAGSAQHFRPGEIAEKAEPVIRSGDLVTVPEGSPVRTKLVIEPVAEKEIKRDLVLPAVVEADPSRTVKVLPPVAGRVVSLKVQLGEHVTQGQELAVIDSGDLAQAYSDDEKARTMLTLTKQVLDRQVGLEKGGGAAIKDREQAQSDYAQAQSEFDRAETRLRSLGVSADQREKTRLLSLKAPVTGSVIDLQVASGAFLNDPTAGIMTIANLDTIWVTANVPEKDTSFVSAGQSVNVTFPAYPGEIFNGKVLFVSDVLDADTRRTKVRIAFGNPNKAFKPNMFANATFVAPTQRVPVVPTSALVLKDDNNQVFVETAPWTFEARNVDIGFQQGDEAVLTSGVKVGDRVVIKGGVLLGD